MEINKNVDLFRTKLRELLIEKIKTKEVLLTEKEILEEPLFQISFHKSEPVFSFFPKYEGKISDNIHNEIVDIWKDC